MKDTPLSSAQKTFLRGLGQRLDPRLKIGKGGLSPALLAELQKALGAHELVKVRLVGSERQERAALCAQIAQEAACSFIGAVGQTALFFRLNPVAKDRQVALPQPN